ncbi:MAG: hypothetical protein ABJA87_02610 [bacterium]
MSTPLVAAPASPEATTGSAGLGRQAVLAAVATAVLAVTASVGPGALLGGVAVLQAGIVLGAVFATGSPGRWGGILIAGVAAAGADVAVSVWPTSALSPLLAVLGLTVPALFVHQLTRGVVRARVVESLSAIALLVVAGAAATGYVQLRNEFGGRRMALAVILAVGVALVLAQLCDLVRDRPRLDTEVARGVPALVVGLVAGAVTSGLLLRDQAGFDLLAAVALGAGLGLLTAFLSVAAGYAEHGLATAVAPNTPDFSVVHRPVAALRPVFLALLPLALLGPVAYVLALALG